MKIDYQNKISKLLAKLTQYANTPGVAGARPSSTMSGDGDGTGAGTGHQSALSVAEAVAQAENNAEKERLYSEVVDSTDTVLTQY